MKIKGYIGGVKGKEHVRNTAGIKLKSLSVAPAPASTNTSAKSPRYSSSRSEDLFQTCLSFHVKYKYVCNPANVFQNVCINMIMRRWREFKKIKVQLKLISMQTVGEISLHFTSGKPLHSMLSSKKESLPVTTLWYTASLNIF